MQLAVAEAVAQGRAAGQQKEQRKAEQHGCAAVDNMAPIYDFETHEAFERGDEYVGTVWYILPDNSCVEAQWQSTWLRVGPSLGPDALPLVEEFAL